MGCRYEWADDSHLIMNVYMESPWTWEEYDSVVSTLFSTLRDLGQPCATAVDVSRIGRIPKGNALMHLNRMEKLMPENVFSTAVVGAPYIVSVFMDIIMRTRPRAGRITVFANSLAEAHEKIRERHQPHNKNAPV